MCLLVWSGFLIDSIYMGLVLVYIQPVCVFWLGMMCFCLFVCFLMSFWIKSVLIIDLYLVFPQPRNCIHQWQCTLSAYIDNCILLNKKIEKWSNSLITDKDRWTYLPSTQRLSLSPGLVQFHPWVLVGSYGDTKQIPGHRWGCSPITQCLVCLFVWWGHGVECMHEGG